MLCIDIMECRKHHFRKVFWKSTSHISRILCQASFLIFPIYGRVFRFLRISLFCPAAADYRPSFSRPQQSGVCGQPIPKIEKIPAAFLGGGNLCEPGRFDAFIRSLFKKSVPFRRPAYLEVLSETDQKQFFGSLREE